MPKYSLNVNGEARVVEAEPDMPLLWVLRDHLSLVGTKFGCGMALCGACTVHVNGQAMRSCVMPMSAVGGGKITTIEGLAQDNKLTELQKAWCDHDVAQCGYCQAGQIMSATVLLRENKNPNDSEIDEAMSGNLCRCATYERIRKAIHQAAGRSMDVPVAVKEEVSK